MNRTTVGYLIFLVSLGAYQFNWAYAQGVDKDSLIKKEQRVMVVDPDGRPIAGVIIKPWGLNTSYFWPENLLGKPIESTTDKNGLASLEYPLLFADEVQCKSIDCVVAHPEYIRAVARIPVSETDNHKITLKKGVRFCLKGIEEDGSPIKERFAAIMSGETPPEFWKFGNDGSIETKGAELGGHQVILVQPMPDNKTRFSEALLFHFNDKDQEDGVVVDDVELLPGIRVFGSLPEHIKRPIKNGVLMACQKPLPVKDAAQLNLRLLTWNDWTTVSEDGAFELISMPRSGRIQLIALCDGWVSPGERISTKGQSFTISDEDLKVELEMQPTMDAIINVKDESGNPIKDAQVAFWPNQMWEDRGSNILGARSKSIDVARIQIEAQGGDIAGTLNFEAYSGKTDELGRIHIRNLPSRSAQEFSVSQKGFTNLTKSIDPPSSSNAGDEKELTERPTTRISVTLKKSDGAH